jgi:hypothetical protein
MGSSFSQLVISGAILVKSSPSAPACDTGTKRRIFTTRRVGFGLGWLTAGQNSIDALPGDLQRLGDLGGALSLGFELADRLNVNGRLAAGIHPGGLRLPDTLHLPFPADRGLELGKYTQHLQEGPAGGGRRVDGLFCRLQGDPFFLKLAHEAGEVRNRACQPVDPRDDDGVAGPCKRDQRCEFLAAGEASAGSFF